MLTQKEKILSKLKHLRGGENMNKFQKTMMSVIKDVRKSKLPNKTAEIIHKTGHRIVMDKFAEVKRHDRGIKDEQLKKSLEAMRSL